MLAGVLVLGGCSDPNITESDSAEAGVAVIPVDTATPDFRYFDGIDGLEFHEQRHDRAPSGDIDSETGMAHYSGESVQPGFPVTEYRVECRSGPPAQVFHFVYNYKRPARVDDDGNIATLPKGYPQDGLAPLAYGELVDEELWNLAGVWVDEDFPGTGFAATLRPLREAGQNDLAFQLSAEHIRYDFNDEEALRSTDFFEYAGWVRAHFYSDNGYPVEVLVIAGDRMRTRSDFVQLEAPSPFGEELDHDVRVYWDDPIVTDRIDCAAEAWQLVKPRVEQLRESDGFSYGTINGSCLPDHLWVLSTFNELQHDEQLAYCEEHQGS